jgi:hypothetical protein
MKLRVLSLSLAAVLLAAGAASAQWQAVQNAFGRTGTVRDNVLRVDFPRSDQTVRKGSVTLAPTFAVKSWVSFRSVGNNRAKVTTDFALLETEVVPLVTRLRAQGYMVAGLHSHLTGETPKMKFLHVTKTGDPVQMANEIRSALSVTGIPLGPMQPMTPSADWTSVNSIIGLPAKSEGNVGTWLFPRRQTVVEQGVTLPPLMGTGTEIQMQMIGSNAALAGNFILLASEVNPVIDVLSRYGITASALQNASLMEQPRLFLLNVWGFGSPQSLAQGVAAALRQTNTNRPIPATR